MAKREKQIFTNPELAHVWASQVQSYGANSSNRPSMFFEEDTIYSYGYHYPMGRIYKQGETLVALINGNGYSITTAKQTGHVWRATTHMRQFYVSDVNDIENSIAVMATDRWEEAFNLLKQNKPYVYDLPRNDKYESIVNRDTLTEYFHNWFETHNEICGLFGFEDKRESLDQELIEVLIDHMLFRKEHNDKLEKTKAFRNAKQNIKRKYDPKHEQCRKDAQNYILKKRQIKEWLKGEIYQCGYSSYTNRKELVRVVGSEVETSGHAKVPLSHALIALKALDSGKDIVGKRLGHYKIDSVDLENNTITIGCHVLMLGQVKHVLKPYVNMELSLVG